ncbi:hypothetical protein KPH14_002482 [Odynerus spinipes]|uniref:C2H2-type domain-containing protein n=1 Tax=Odynerus spinipes TaxID=1348599 RepID=A0AAD9RTD0_9HYME|nr:hypothetical protein KPH14_002482 [Odynerus spinipes]
MYGAVVLRGYEQQQKILIVIEISQEQRTNRQIVRPSAKKLKEEEERCHQRHSCPTCKSTFSKKANMMRHYRYECGKEPRFQCPYCGKRDRKSSNMYRHIRQYHQGSSIQAYKLY